MLEYARGFYESQQWKACRAAFMNQKLWTCERCGKLAEVVHHKIYIKPENINDPFITLCFDNLEALCHDCHNKEHKKEKLKLNYCFGEDGSLKQPALFWKKLGENSAPTCPR